MTNGRLIADMQREARRLEGLAAGYAMCGESSLERLHSRAAADIHAAVGSFRAIEQAGRVCNDVG